MRRRSKRAPNLSESTGEIGQELPANQPAPLVPSYSDQPPMGRAAAPQEPPRQVAQSHSQVREQRTSAPPRTPRPERHEWIPPAGPGQLEVETQPEMPSLPSAEPQPADRSPQAPKGYVVLTIGLPGS